MNLQMCLSGQLPFNKGGSMFWGAKSCFGQVQSADHEIMCLSRQWKGRAIADTPRACRGQGAGELLEPGGRGQGNRNQGVGGRTTHRDQGSSRLGRRSPGTHRASRVWPIQSCRFRASRASRLLRHPHTSCRQVAAVACLLALDLAPGTSCSERFVERLAGNTVLCFGQIHGIATPDPLPPSKGVLLQ